jgi:hypothetical protein
MHEEERLQAMDLVDHWKMLPQCDEAVMALNF